MTDQEKTDAAWFAMMQNAADWAKNIEKGVTHHKGIPVVLYNQRFDPRTKEGGELTSGGFCLAMSIMWIVKTARGESFWDWFHPPAVACPNVKNKYQVALRNPIVPLLTEIMRHEKQRGILAQQFTATGAVIDVAMYMKIQSWWAPKVSHDSAAQRFQGGEGLISNVVDGSLVADLLLKPKAKSSFKLLSVSGPGGAHAMTCRIVDRGVVFMDPNCGELYFETVASFRNFFKAFWRIKYSRFGEIVYVNAFTDPEMIKYG